MSLTIYYQIKKIWHDIACIFRFETFDKYKVKFIAIYTQTTRHPIFCFVLLDFFLLEYFFFRFEI
jgi:hypothetical protein